MRKYIGHILRTIGSLGALPWLTLAVLADGWATHNTKEAWSSVKFMYEADSIWEMATDMSDLDWQ